MKTTTELDSLFIRTKGPRGQPRKPLENVASERLQLRFTSADKVLVETMAAEDRVTTTKFVLALVKAEAARRHGT